MIDILDAADYLRRAFKEIPRIQSAFNGSKCQKAAEVHKGAFKFNSPLGWVIWKYYQERLLFRPYSISAITVCTRI